MAESILAIFDTADEAVEAVEKLRREGVPREEIILMSSEPIHTGPDEKDQKPKSRIGLFAIAGAIFGGVGGYLLVALTSRSVNLVTGGMPIVSPWPFSIIIYELTALGAILGAVGRMIYEARLARRNSPADYDEAVADGRVAVAVRCDDSNHLAAAQSVLGPNLKP
jgi:uncharacterized membrane protein